MEQKSPQNLDIHVPILQSWSKVLGHFALLPTYGLSVHLHLPTPNTVMLIHPK